MTSLQSRRERVLAEAVVSNYLNELSPRERPAPRPERSRVVERVVTLRRARSRRRPELAAA
jgi:hypothetical protein